MDPTDLSIEWWRRRLFWILDHYVISTKNGDILRKPSYKLQEVLEEFIESVIAGDESHTSPTAEQPMSNQHNQEDE